MEQADWMERLLGEMADFIKDSAFQHVHAATEAEGVTMAAKHTGKVVVLTDAHRRRRAAG